MSRQTCAKQGTFLAEATGDICTLDLKQSWLGVFRLQQQLTEEALKKHESHSAPVNNVDLSDTALEVDGDRKLAVACQHFAGCDIIAELKMKTRHGCFCSGRQSGSTFLWLIAISRDAPTWAVSMEVCYE